MSKKVTHIKESQLKTLIKKVLKETLTRALNESFEAPEDKWNREQQADEDMRYEMGELQKAFQKQNGTYHKKSENGEFQTGDKVVVHTRKGDIQGTISDFDMNFMTYEETAEVDFDDNGITKTLICCPLNKIEKTQ